MREDTAQGLAKMLTPGLAGQVDFPVARPGSLC